MPLPVARPAPFVDAMWPGSGDRLFATTTRTLHVLRSGAWSPFYEGPAYDAGARSASGDWVIANRILRWNDPAVDVLSDEVNHSNVYLDLYPWSGGRDDIWSARSHWDGRAWSKDALVLDGAVLGGVSGSDLWALYDRIRHYDGTRWSEVPRPGNARLLALHATRGDDVWAAGMGGTLLRWDGKVWSTVDSGTDRNLLSVWASGSGDVWLMTHDGAVLRSDDGQPFRSVLEPDAAQLEYLKQNPIAYRLYGMAPGDVWVPWPSRAAQSPSTRLFHFQAGRIAEVPTPEPVGPVNTILGVAPDDAWIAGTALLHWDGRALTHGGEVPTEILAMAGERRDDLWAVGWWGLVLHFDGVRWTRQRSLTGGNLVGVWSNDGLVTIVGRNGEILEHRRR